MNTQFGKTLASALCAAMVTATAAKADVLRCEYLTISGANQNSGVRLLTDYVPKNNTVVRAKYASSSSASSNNNQFLFCSRFKASASADALNFCFAPNVNGKFRFDYYATQAAAGASFTADRDYELLVSGGKAYVTDTVTESVTELGPGLQSFTPQYKMALFQSYTMSGSTYTGWANSFHGKFYYLKIYEIENDVEVLKHEFVPCIEDGVAKLRDIADANQPTYELTVASGSAAAGGVIEDRTATYPAPYDEGTVLSNLGIGSLILDETDYPVNEANALRFTGFEAVANSTTIFDGGWWDFGGGDFPTNAASDRTVILRSGAVVTNVASMPLLNYFRNKFNLLGASRFHVTGDAVLDYGGSDSNHSNEFCVAEGSAFIVGGDIKMSVNQAVTNGRRKEGSVLKVTGAGSYAKAANLRMSPENVNGPPGDCRAVVTDHGVLEIPGTISLGAGSRTFDNRLYVTDGGAVTAATVNVGAGWQSNYDASLDSGFEVHVLNGGVLRANTGFYIGITSSSNAGASGMKLVVSNATFSAAKFRPFGLGTMNRNSEVRISGPQAKFEVESTDPLFGMAGGNRFIVENGAKVDFPWTACSYTANSANNTVLVTGTGTVLTLNDNFGLSGAADNSTSIMGFTNSLCIADGGTVTGAFVRVHGDAGTLAVSNGTLLVSSKQYATVPSEPATPNAFPALTAGVRFKYGGASTNCIVRLSGESPRIACVGGASADLRGSTKLVFDIPETGYNYGGSDYVPFDVSNTLTISANCEILFTGLDKKATRDAIDANGGSVPLVRAKTMYVNNAVLAAAQSELPKGYKLKMTGTAGTEQVLSLRSSADGTVLSFR